MKTSSKNILVIGLPLLTLLAGLAVLFLVSQAEVGTEKIEIVSQSQEANVSETKKTLDKSQEELMPEKISEPIEIIFLGDLMFDRYVRQKAQQNGNDFIFEKVCDLLKEADLAVANLEGPITDNKSVSVNTLENQRGHFTFTFDPSLAETLAKCNIKVVNLGNNHILNFEEDGVFQTKKYLEEKKVEFFGDIDTEDSKQLIKKIAGTKVAFVNYNQFSFDSYQRTLEAINSAKTEADYVFVYTHWGDEYETVASQSQRKKAHAFVDAGADAVIGSHPHVIQDAEIYQDKKIYYSLGNFVFDQYFSEDTRKGLAVKMTLQENGDIKFEEANLRIETNGQTKLE